LTGDVAFWDSSVLVPLCVRQDNTDRIRGWTARYGTAVWWSARVEIKGAIARLQRDGEIDAAGSKDARFALTKLTDSWSEVAPSDEVRDKAEELLVQFPLRAADSLQLGAALVWCRERPKGRVFLCADVKLAEAAEQVGFLVMKP